MENSPTYLLHGLRVHALKDSWREIGSAPNGPGGHFAGNLDSLHDALAGGMGQPANGRCTFVWEDSTASRAALGYDEMVSELKARLGRCHASNVPLVAADLELARARQGPTVFDRLIEAFKTSPATIVLR